MIVAFEQPGMSLAMLRIAIAIAIAPADIALRAQQMMANGGLERLMSNPNIRNMAERMQSGGGMPSMSELANDPSLRDM